MKSPVNFSSNMKFVFSFFSITLLLLCLVAAAVHSLDLIVSLHEQVNLGKRPTATDAQVQLLVNDLRSVAEETQRPLRHYLDEHLKVKYTPLWIVNAIALHGISAAAAKSLFRQFGHMIASVETDHRVYMGPSDTPIDQEEHPTSNERRQGELLRRRKKHMDHVEPNLFYVQADRMWSSGYTGRNITIAVVDSGVDVNHPALRTRYRGFRSTHDYHWFDPYRRSETPHDWNGHGTHCAGIAVGIDQEGGNDQPQRHWIGVAPGAQLIACLGIDVNSPRHSSTLLQCWQFALAPTDLKGRGHDVSRRAHIVSNSWGLPVDASTRATGILPHRYHHHSNNNKEHHACSMPNRIFDAAAKVLRRSGIFVVASAGNEGDKCSSLLCPAVHSSVMAVCAVEHRNTSQKFERDSGYTNGTIMPWSSRGPVPKELYRNEGGAAGNSKMSAFYMKPDVCAPGSQITSSLPGGRYAALSGTSMAAPHVAGAVALLWEAVPELLRDVEQTEQILRRGSLQMQDNRCSDKDGDNSNGVPNEVYGWGNLKIWKTYIELHLKRK